MAVGLPLVAAAVLGAEVMAARGGTRLPDVTLQYAAAGPTTAVWLGDSTAVGVGVVDGADGVASRVAAARGERVVMLAVSGATVADVLAEQVDRVAAARPGVVYISVGANDVTHFTRPGAFRDRYNEVLGRMPPGVPVIVLGVPDMGAPPRLAQPLRAIAGWRGRRLDEELRRAAAFGGRATYVDIGGRTGPAFRRNPDAMFAADEYHPSAAGYQQWAEAVVATLGVATVGP